MSESMQVLPSASAGASQSKLPSLESGSSPVSSEEAGAFNAALASYFDAETGVTGEPSEIAFTEMGELLPQELIESGNMLPQDENAAIWQALMLVQPQAPAAVTLMSSVENPVTKEVSSQLQSIRLLDDPSKPIINPALINRELYSSNLDKQDKSALNPNLLNQNYFNSMLMQNKDAVAVVPEGVTSNNMNIQLSAAHFNPATNEALILNMSEQPAPVQATNSLLSQSLASVGFGTATQAAVTQTQMAPLNLGQNAWETNLGSRLQMMVGQNVQTAEIRLDPPELGTLDIKIKISNDVASVNITSAHAQVRDALETAVPRLREMFEESGLSLGDVNVRQESFAEHKSAEEEKGSFAQNVESEHGDEPAVVTRKIVNDNLLDIYA